MVAGLQTSVYNLADLDPSEASAAKAAGLDVFVQPGLNAENISININKAPFKGNPTLVEALRYAINRQQFVQQLTFGYGEATDEVFPPGFAGYNPADANLWPYNLAKAKQLLAKAGYKPNQLTLPLVISADTETPEAEIVQSQLAAVGIKVTITVNTNWATPFFAKQLVFSLYGTTGRDSQTETLRDHFGSSGVLNLRHPTRSQARSGSRQGRGDADRLTRLRGEPAGGNGSGPAVRGADLPLRRPEPHGQEPVDLRAARQPRSCRLHRRDHQRPVTGRDR